MLIPRKIFRGKHSYKQKTMDGDNEESSYNVNSREKEIIANYKYFLTNPDLCSLFSTSIKYKKLSFNDGSIVMQSLSFYSYTEIKWKHSKRYALELMLKLALSRLKIKSDLHSYSFNLKTGDSFNYSKRVEEVNESSEENLWEKEEDGAEVDNTVV